MVTLTQAFDSTCICVTLPIIASELDASVSESLSLGTTFLLATTVSQPFFSELSHVVGRKPAYLAALTVFLGGTVICGLARSSLVLLVGRTVQGAGAGGPQALSAVILTDLFPLRKRARYVSFLNVPWAVGTIAGPLIGGAFAGNERVGWRWIFWINIPTLALSMLGASFLLGYDRPQQQFWCLLARVDWVGILLFVISAVSLLLPLSWGGSNFTWTSPQVLTPIVASAMGFITLGGFERWYAKKPMFPPSVFRDRSTIMLYITTMLHGMILYMVLYYLAVFYLGVKSLSPVMTGVWALPATLTVAPSAMVVGIVLSKTGQYRWFLLCGWCLTTISLGVMILIDEDMPSGTLIPITALLGIAMGVLVPAMSVGVQATVGRKDAGHAVAMIYVLRSAGQCLGVAVGLSVFSSRLRFGLQELGQGKDAAQDTMKAIRHSIKTGDLADAAMLDAVVTALSLVWVTGCAIAAVSGILAICTKCPPLPEDETDPPLQDQSSGAFVAPPCWSFC
ncbi:major facilitator superfamily domain-containing protein [Dactylonectria estremocensis]|uniref:Major facilitator superfamily domain-containing protein n=1 Tax=Dactylonectria estremocensis TaxID=1079267 RepID=A0A9P9DV06_9HYPO|nr:major facilitator superfamily domain-containing protein [Dactylonectria estremocensis]